MVSSAKVSHYLSDSYDTAWLHSQAKTEQQLTLSSCDSINTAFSDHCTVPMCHGKATIQILERPLVKSPPNPPQRPTCTKRRDKDNEWLGRLALGFIGQANSLWCETPFWWWAVWGRCCIASHSLHSGDPEGDRKRWTRHININNLSLSGTPLVGLLVRGHRGSRSFGVLRCCGTLAEHRVTFILRV